MKVICYEKSCLRNKGERCILKEITINGAGQCLNGVMAPFEELLKIDEEFRQRIEKETSKATE